MDESDEPVVKEARCQKSYMRQAKAPIPYIPVMSLVPADTCTLDVDPNTPSKTLLPTFGTPAEFGSDTKFDPVTGDEENVDSLMAVLGDESCENWDNNNNDHCDLKDWSREKEMLMQENKFLRA